MSRAPADGSVPLLLVVLAVFAVLVALVGTPFVAAGQSQDGGQAITVETFAYAGEGAVATPQERPFLWQSSSHSFDVELASGDGGGDYEVCIESQPTDADSSTGLACRTATVEAGGGTTVSVAVDEWPANLTGEQEVSAVVTSAGDSGGEPVARQSLTVTVLQRTADPDEDGLTNEREAAAGTDFFAPDSDDDGLMDGLEVDTYETDPNEADSDGDGLTDGAEVNRHQTDPAASDTDGDGLDDDQEVNEYGTNPNKADTDGDGLTDAEEVNTYGTNPNEPDTDGDGLGDAAEVNEYGTNPTEADTDGDGLEDGPEVTVYSTDPNERDSDGDGLDDGDEVEGATDPLVPDADQAADGSLFEVPREVVGALFVVGALVLLALFVFFRRSAGGGVAARLRDLGTPPDDGAAGTGSESTTGQSGVAGSPPEGATAPIPTNRNRVLTLLGENGGRMLQSDIVDQTDWSKSKVSRVLSDMDEDGEIAKIDVGKGNLIALPEVAPQSSRSPLDGEEE